MTQKSGTAGISGNAAIASTASGRGACFMVEEVISSLLVVMMMASRERPPQQHRDDDRKDDHLFKGAGEKGGIGFKQANQEGGQRGGGIAAEASDDGGDETFEADQKSGVVGDRCKRADQNSRHGSNQSCQCERHLSCHANGDANETRPTGSPRSRVAFSRA